MMKKHILLLSVALSCLLVSCKTVSMEQQIDNIFEFGKSNDFKSILDQAYELPFTEYVDYYMYVLSEKMKVKDIWSQTFTLEGSYFRPTNVVADIKGKNESDQLLIISADITNPITAVSAIEVFYILKKAKINHNNTIRLILYDSDAGLDGYYKIARSRAEAHLIDFEITKNINKSYSHFVTNEREEMLKSLEGIANQYCGSHFPVKFEFQDDTFKINPRYTLSTDDYSSESFENVVTNTSAIASIIYLLN